MLTNDVRNWIKKVKLNQYSYNDAINEFINISKYLTKEELKQIKHILENSYKT